MYIKTLKENVQSTENAYKHANMCCAREFFTPWNINLCFTYVLNNITSLYSTFLFFFYKRLKQPVLLFQKRFSLRLSSAEANQLLTVLKNLKIILWAIYSLQNFNDKMLETLLLTWKLTLTICNILKVLTNIMRRKK